MGIKGVSSPQTWVEDPADHAREHHEEHWQQFEVTTHDAASLHMGQTTSCEAPLDYHLKKYKTGKIILCREKTICIHHARNISKEQRWKSSQCLSEEDNLVTIKWLVAAFIFIFFAEVVHGCYKCTLLFD